MTSVVALALAVGGGASPTLDASSVASVVPVVPARLLETRAAPNTTIDGQFQGQGRRSAGDITELVVAGRGGVPTDAVAVFLNVTVANPDAPGFVTVWPCGAEMPISSNLNYLPGDYVPNAVLTKIGTGGAVCLYTHASTHLIVDVNGYVGLTPAAATPSTTSPATTSTTSPATTSPGPTLPSTQVQVINPSDGSVDDDGNYRLDWICSGLCSNVYSIQEDATKLFAAPTTYQRTDGQTYWDFSGKPEGTYCYRVTAAQLAWSNAVCVTVDLPAATLRVLNDSHYYIVDLRLNGQQFVESSLDVIPVGNALEIEYSGAGTVVYNIGIGFWPSGGRDTWFTYSGTTSVTVGSTQTLNVPNPTVVQMLTDFGTSKTWSSTFYDYSTGLHTYSYVFTSAGTWQWYRDGTLTASGQVSSGGWPDYSYTYYWRECSTCGNVAVAWPFGVFYVENGPPGWRIVEYVMQ